MTFAFISDVADLLLVLYFHSFVTSDNIWTHHIQLCFQTSLTRRNP